MYLLKWHNVFLEKYDNKNIHISKQLTKYGNSATIDTNCVFFNAFC